MNARGAGLLQPCTRCGRPVQLLGRLSEKQRICAPCWIVLGQPFPEPDDATAVHQREVETRERMLARGGEDRHRVRAGKS